MRRHRDDRLDEQRTSLARIIQKYGMHATYLTIGAPEFMVIARRINPNRYLFIINGICRHIEANTPGGMEGWLQQVTESQPDVIVLGPTSGKYTDKIFKWLDANYELKTVGSWEIYVRKIIAG